MKASVSITALVCIAWAGQLHADVLFLRNGTRIEGKIVAQSRASIRIQTGGGTRVVPRTNVRRITFGPFNPASAPAADDRRKRQELQKQAQLAALARQREELERQRQAELLKQQYDNFVKEQEARREAARRLADEAEARAKAAQAERPVTKQPAAAERTETRTDSSSSGGDTKWYDYLLPGVGQFRQGRGLSGGFYTTGLLAGLAGAGYFAGQAPGIAAEYGRLETIINLWLITGSENTGALPDLLLTLQRDDTGNRGNAVAAGTAGSLGLVGAVYLMNAVDLALFSNGDSALRLRLETNEARLAFQIRY